MSHIDIYKEQCKNYPMLNQAAIVLAKPQADLIGRDVDDLRKGIRNPEKANVVLLAEPGSGKAIDNNEWLPVADDRGYIRMGDVKVGDYVFDDSGQPTKVVGVYPQGRQNAYKVILKNGAFVVCNDEHLWSVRNKNDHCFTIKTLRTLLDAGITKTAEEQTTEKMKWYIPSASAIDRKEQIYGIHPYVIGALLGDCLTIDEFVAEKVAMLLGVEYEKEKHNQLVELSKLEDIVYMTNKESHEKCIPTQYLLGSIDQRWALLQGLMDTGGCIKDDDRLNCIFSTSSKSLADDVTCLAFSLGLNVVINENKPSISDNIEYYICFVVENIDKLKLFTLPRKLASIHTYLDTSHCYLKHYDDIGIQRVEELHTDVEMTCIRVEANSHLFQVTKSHIVTHNTAYVQGFAYEKETLKYYLTLEVTLEKLIRAGEDKDTSLLTGFTGLLEDASRYSVEQNVIVVLFIDEIHKVAMLSPTLVESIKPLLEKSAVNNFRIIAATTFKEYNDHLAGNRAFDQRFLQIKLPELSKSEVIKILKNRAKQANIAHMLAPNILGDIYTESKRILLSNAQPRASIDIFQMMVSQITKTEYMKDGVLVREYHTPNELGLNSKYSLSRPILRKIIKRTHGIDIDNEVNVKKVICALKTQLFNQDQAIDTIVSYLEMAAQGFTELDRPKISFLSTGPTGSGKPCFDGTPVPIWTKDGTTLYKPHGDLQVGDYIFNRKGEPKRIEGFFPKGLLDAYKIVLSDGNEIICSDEHLWTYKNRHGNGAKHWKTHTLRELMKKKITTLRADGRVEMNFVIPHNEAIKREPYCVENNLHPYVLGTLIGNGCLTETVLGLSSDDEETVECVANYLTAHSYEKVKACYTWVFAVDGSKRCNGLARIHTKDVLASVPELIGKKSGEKFIPEKYKGGSVKQRWELIQGLFDTDGTIINNSRYNVSYSTTSKQLAEDVREVLYSLGISTTLVTNCRMRDERELIEYSVHVQVQNKDKYKFFKLKRKKDIALEAAKVVKIREKKFDVLGIREIVPLHKKLPMSCIMVDDEEHLYQVGKGHIVTHNTELAKIISDTMQLPLKRFDMSRYSNEKDAGAFADDLFRAAWSTPNAYILIDEVEKSSRQAMNILLQVLDDARLTDSINPDRVASFSGAIINLTTNLASEIYQNMNKHQGKNSRIDTELIYKALADAEVFETAVLGRIDAIVPFMPLQAPALEKIAIRMLQDFIDAAETKKRKIIVSDDVIPYIVKDRTSNDTERGGARDVKRNVKNLVAQVLAHYLTYATDEVPIILYIKGKPRFKHAEIADPLNAKIALKVCFDTEYIDALLEKLSQSVGKPLINKGLYLPNDVNITTYAQDIVNLAANGYNKFKSTVDGETFIIEGVE